MTVVQDSGITAASIGLQSTSCVQSVVLRTHLTANKAFAPEHQEERPGHFSKCFRNKKLYLIPHHLK